MPTRACPGCEEVKCYGAEYRFCQVCDPEGDSLILTDTAGKETTLQELAPLPQGMELAWTEEK
jgi:hypothetical protein